MATETRSITGVDFASIPTKDLEESVAFYRDVLQLPLSVHRPERFFAEFETGNLTLNILESEKMGLGFEPNLNPLALHVEPSVASRLP